jgi:hypothetical protein
MTLLLSLIVGLVVWLVLWAIDVKSFDAFLITIMIVLIAGTARVVAPRIRSRGQGGAAGEQWTPR